MKERLFKILILFLVLVITCVCFLNLKKPKKYKILSVLEADEFYIDINKNDKIEDNERVVLKSIQALRPIKTRSLDKLLKDKGMNFEQYLKVGYLARSWAKENLENKEVFVYGLDDCYKGEICKVDIYYNNNNLAKTLLKNGLAFPLPNSKHKDYFQFYNLSKIKNNAQEMSKIDFLLVNLKTNIAHILDSDHARMMTYAMLLPKKEILKSNVILCSSCFNIDKNYEKSDYKIPKSKNVYPKSISKSFGNIDLYLINPLASKRPSTKCDSEFCARILKEINSSKESIDVALYGFGEQKEIFDSLLRAKKRGVKIRAVCNYSKNMDEIYPYTSLFIKEFSAVCNKKHSLMHNKFFIFDNKTVLSGSTNISSTGSGGYNANLAFVIKDEKIAKIYKQEFEKMHNSKFSHDKEKTSLSQDNSSVKVYFSPEDDVYENAFLPNIKNAKKSIYVSVFYLTDKNMIEELILAGKRGVRVLVLLDATSANNFKGRVKYLRAQDVPVIVENWGGKNHEKTIVVDDEILITGSSNFSKSGFSKNDENVIVIKNPEIARFYSDYYLYLFNSIDKKFLNLIPRAEGHESKNSCYDGIDNNFDGKIDKDDEGCAPRQQKVKHFVN